MAFDIPARERAQRALTMLRAGYLGAPHERVKPNPEATRLLFDGITRQLDTSAAPGATIQWEFTDAEPWYLRVENGFTAAAPGRAPHPDLTFRCRLESWLDLTSGRSDPLRAVAAGKIRVRGKLRLLVRAPRLFA